MERKVQTREYQDPLERAYEKRFPWTFILHNEPAPDTPIYITADDWSGREFALPAGVILEIAEHLRTHEPVAN